ncbi:MAG: hypothetical protein HYV59_09695 [Planctomycetes bacterium]|nr:hypothetical protein [Planctomycetota bacterium]
MIKLSVSVLIITFLIFFLEIEVSNGKELNYKNSFGDIIGKNNPILHYTHTTVRSPVMDEARLDIPEILKNNKLAAWGFVDVTSPPFLADPTGQRDSTKAIQDAINMARDYQMVCYFPLGIYKISETLSCIQDFYIRQNGKILPATTFFCSLMGERSKGNKRPKIYLAPNSPGFNNPYKPKYVVHFWTRDMRDLKRDSPSWAFNQKFVNIDIEIGTGNSGAVAIRLRGAEGSGIMDSTIDATHGLIGVSGGSGSGGSHTNITVIGGKIGMDLKETQPTPVLAGITLLNQSETALLYGGRQSLCAVGVKIVTKIKGPVIKITPDYDTFFQGPLCLVDSEIIFEENDKNSCAILTNRCAYLNNVYIKGVTKVILNSDGSEVIGNPNGWIRIQEYAHYIKPKAWEGMQYDQPIYINGIKITNDTLECKIEQEPPQDLVSKHIWNNNFPSWDSKGAVNIKLSPYNAKGDGYSDDTQAIQKAIDENERVFLPKGFYRVKKTINLKPNTKLIGIDPYFSTIMIREKEGYFKDPDNPKPIVETANIKEATTILDCIGIYVPREVPGAYALKWQCGGESILRIVKPRLAPLCGYGAPAHLPERKKPLSIITGFGGGRWYNQYSESVIENPDYRNILVDGITGPLSFYMFQSQYAKSDAISEIKNSNNITIFGVKGEGIVPVLWVRNSNNIRIFGYGGNAAPLGEHSIFKIENVPNFLIVNAIDHPRYNVIDPDVPAGPGRHPKEWSIITELTKDGEIIKTTPFDRPVLYKRGEPSVLSFN